MHDLRTNMFSGLLLESGRCASTQHMAYSPTCTATALHVPETLDNFRHNAHAVYLQIGVRQHFLSNKHTWHGLAGMAYPFQIVTCSL